MINFVTVEWSLASKNHLLHASGAESPHCGVEVELRGLGLFGTPPGLRCIRLWTFAGREGARRQLERRPANMVLTTINPEGMFGFASPVKLALTHVPGVTNKVCTTEKRSELPTLSLGPRVSNGSGAETH